jgi:hypothetical protein
VKSPWNTASLEMYSMSCCLGEVTPSRILSRARAKLFEAEKTECRSRG